MGSSRTRARTCVPCIGRRILNCCDTREALYLQNFLKKCWDLSIFLSNYLTLYYSFIIFTCSCQHLEPDNLSHILEIVLIIKMIQSWAEILMSTYFPFFLLLLRYSHMRCKPNVKKDHMGPFIDSYSILKPRCSQKHFSTSQQSLNRW